MELIQQLLPEAKTVAILYSTGEENSRIQAESAVAAFEAAGLTAESYTANDSNDISSVVTEACTQADVIYVPTDNLMAANMELVKNVALNQKVPVVSCFTADENDGALLSISISYYTMGYLAGEMAYEILVNGADPASMPIGVMSVAEPTPPPCPSASCLWRIWTLPSTRAWPTSWASPSRSPCSST